MSFRFRHHIIDTDLPGGGYAQTALADLDSDGRLEYIVGQRSGDIFWYKCHTPDRWQRHLLGEDSPSDVGGCVLDVLSCEMEAVGGENEPRWYIWENVDGRGGTWREHVILDANLGGHELVVGDVTGNGKPDIVGKPWRARPGNAVDGRFFVVFLENVTD